MYKPIIVLGTLAFVTPASAQQPYDGLLRKLGSEISSCSEIAEKAPASISLELLIKTDILRDDRYRMSFPAFRPWPLGVVAYHKADDPQRLASAQAMMSDEANRSRVRYKVLEYSFEEVLSTLESEYSGEKGVQALKALVAKKGGEVKADKYLMELYWPEAEAQLKSIFGIKDPKQFKREVLNDYIKLREVKAADYNRQLLQLREEGMFRVAYRHFVKKELDKIDPLSRYRVDKGREALKQLTRGHDLKAIFLAAAQRTSQGSGTFEDNLAMHPVFKVLIEATPADKRTSLFSSEIVERRVQHWLGQDLFRLTYDKVPLVIPAEVAAKELMPSLRSVMVIPMDGSAPSTKPLTITMNARVGCADKAELEAAFAKLPKFRDERLAYYLSDEQLIQLVGVQTAVSWEFRGHQKMDPEPRVLVYVAEKITSAK